GYEETSSQIGIENQIPVVPSNVQSALTYIAAGIVNKDFEMTACSFRGFHHSLNALLFTHVQLKRNHRSPQGFELLFKGHQALPVSAGQNQIGTGFGQRPREILPEPTARSRNDGSFSLEIEKRVAHAVPPGVSTTFVNPGSRWCSRLNHSGPSPKGATAVISDFTLIAPLVSNSIARGYSPAD